MFGVVPSAEAHVQPAEKRDSLIDADYFLVVSPHVYGRLHVIGVSYHLPNGCMTHKPAPKRRKIRKTDTTIQYESYRGKVEKKNTILLIYDILYYGFFHFKQPQQE